MAQESINLVISCKNLVDDTGAEPVSSGLVAIAGKRISYAGSVGEAPEFPNALVIDLPEATLLPGLIDCIPIRVTTGRSQTREPTPIPTRI